MIPGDSKLREIAKRIVARGLRVDTFPDHWKCGACDNREPHVHTIVGRHDHQGRPIYDWCDCGYDVREEQRLFEG